MVASLSANSKQEEGYKVMKDIVTAHTNVAAVFSCNDPMAVGAAQAIKDAGKSGSKDIFVVGYNGDQIALEAIKAGDMIGTVQQVPYEMGKMTVALATKLMNGEKLTFDNAEAREIYVPVKLLTPADLGVTAPAQEDYHRFLGVRHAVWFLPGYGKRHQGSCPGFRE